MKNLVSPLVASLIIVSAVGCKKMESNAKYKAPQLPDFSKLSEEALNDSNLYDGGQPGVISINGVISNDGKLDNRVFTSQKAGKNRKNQETALKLKTSLEMNSLEIDSQAKRKSALKSLEDNRTYINLGCELSESEVAGLTDKTSQITTENINQLTASRIFICGKQKWNASLNLTLWASEIILNQADITFEKSHGYLSMNANTLILAGDNKLSTGAKSSSILVSPAANLSLFVGTELFGEGKLSLESQGADCVVSETDVKLSEQ
jgi:hypothetical protein